MHVSGRVSESVIYARVPRLTYSPLTYSLLAMKIFMPLGDATEAMDTFYPYYRLQEDGFDVVIAGPEARLYHTVLHEIPPDSNVPWDITQERPGYFIKATLAFRDAKGAISPARLSPAAVRRNTSATTKTSCASCARFIRPANRSPASATASRFSPPPASSAAAPSRPSPSASSTPSKAARSTSIKKSSSTATSSPRATGWTTPTSCASF